MNQPPESLAKISPPKLYAFLTVLVTDFITIGDIEEILLRVNEGQGLGTPSALQARAVHEIMGELEDAG